MSTNNYISHSSLKVTLTWPALYCMVNLRVYGCNDKCQRVILALLSVIWCSHCRARSPPPSPTLPGPPFSMQESALRGSWKKSDGLMDGSWWISFVRQALFWTDPQGWSAAAPPADNWRDDQQSGTKPPLQQWEITMGDVYHRATVDTTVDLYKWHPSL